MTKFANIFNFDQQDLKNGYSASIDSYNDPETFQYFLQNKFSSPNISPSQENSDSEQQNKEALLEFTKEFSVVGFINQCVVKELLVKADLYSLCIQRLCKLEEHLSLVSDIFFMGAGHAMNEFS